MMPSAAGRVRPSASVAPSTGCARYLTTAELVMGVFVYNMLQLWYALVARTSSA
jgi:hypothetical protein